MPLDLANVHKLAVREGTNQMEIVGRAPYVRFVHREVSEDGKVAPEGYAVICQNGGFYGDGGARIKRKDVPDWVWDQARLMIPEAREKVKLKLPEELPDDVDEIESNEPAPQGRAPKEILNIVDAVHSLDPGNDDHWTREGLPNIKAVGILMGRVTTRAEIEQFCPGHQRS
jgi:hypothetical protein|tara:strand:- start:1071 stop:1583 length:513 start_codon:yes stop_codon:yes gene_type:complete